MATRSTYTEDDDQQEIDVGNVVELKPKVQWNKSQGSILGRPDLVPYIIGFVVALFILSVFRERKIKKDPPFLLIRVGLCGITVHCLLLRNRAAAGLSLFFVRRGPLVEPIHDGHTFPHSALAGGSLRGPSHALDRLRDMTLSPELYQRHDAEGVWFLRASTAYPARKMEHLPQWGRHLNRRKLERPLELYCASD